ncbi:hypothetical protein [Leuconostoc pseudomesenteroides]|uniref:Alanyl-tRNA synthetase n=1 Tax=Leuconostoc pseudomesenteroides TaxID=33968 RepID=A0ABT6HCW7_LEUPS|nr:hypothetical protein [Leuconostoc pseudomesenteroides]MDG9733649.1 alanyl-tRNA synthetase [Leuconostoc pseudomesenteroides]
MSEKPKKIEKKNVLYLVIAGLLIVIIIMSFYIHTLRNRSTTTIVTAPTKTSSSVSSASSSSTSKYVEGKDYTVKYSNDGIVAKSSIDEALSNVGLNNFDDDMDKDSGNYAKFELYFNKSKNVIVEKLYENGYQNNEPTVIIAYDLSTKKQIEGHIGRLYYDNMPLVYTWTNNTVQ